MNVFVECVKRSSAFRVKIKIFVECVFVFLCDGFMVCEFIEVFCSDGMKGLVVVNVCKLLFDVIAFDDVSFFRVFRRRRDVVDGDVVV